MRLAALLLNVTWACATSKPASPDAPPFTFGFGSGLCKVREESYWVCVWGIGATERRVMPEKTAAFQAQIPLEFPGFASLHSDNGIPAPCLRVNRGSLRPDGANRRGSCSRSPRPFEAGDSAPCGAVAEIASTPWQEESTGYPEVIAIRPLTNRAFDSRLQGGFAAR